MPEVYADDQVTIESYEALGPMANNAYVIRPRRGGPVTLVDLPAGVEAALDGIGAETIERVIVTHAHGDHWGGYDTFRARSDAPILVGAEETGIDGEREVERLAHGADLPVGTATMRIIHTPGHTPGSICLHIGNALISGDTLFPGGPGYSRSHELLEQEIASITSRLHTLAPETRVLPGHGGSTTIGESRAEYEVFASRDHDADLHGDVLWLES